LRGYAHPTLRVAVVGILCQVTNCSYGKAAVRAAIIFVKIAGEGDLQSAKHPIF
jgi:hypothetical protein